MECGQINKSPNHQNVYLFILNKVPLLPAQGGDRFETCSGSVRKIPYFVREVFGKASEKSEAAASQPGS